MGSGYPLPDSGELPSGSLHSSVTGVPRKTTSRLASVGDGAAGPPILVRTPMWGFLTPYRVPPWQRCGRGSASSSSIHTVLVTGMAL